MVIATTGGDYEKVLREAWFDPFTKMTGIKVVTVSATNTEMRAQVKAMTESKTVIWDIYQSSETTRRFEGFFDWDDLPNMAMEFLDRLPSPPHYRAVIVDEAQDCTPVMIVWRGGC